MLGRRRGEGEVAEFGLAGTAVAHRTTPLTAEEAAGLEIAGLTHGEMGHVAAYRSAIVDLAARQFPTDETFRRLLNHANIQFSYCAWGLVPNALTDEENPFNECSHAYLAAYRAVLARMAEMPGQPQAAEALADRIDAEIRADPEAEALCQYSVEPFYTGTVLSPTPGEGSIGFVANHIAPQGAVARIDGTTPSGLRLEAAFARQAVADLRPGAQLSLSVGRAYVFPA